MQLYGLSTMTHRRQAWSLLAHVLQQTHSFSSLPPVGRPPDGRGKPCFPSHPDCQFNLSHSGPFALCGVDSCPVGVDIQVVKSTWRSQLPQRVCSPQELDWLETQPDCWSAFTLLWTLKESWVKQSGCGLTIPISSIPVPLPVPGQTQYQQDGLYIRIYSGPGWFASMCAHRPPPTQILWLDSHVISHTEEVLS